jgi:hypothetical protein
MTRLGKIARLPRKLREELNVRLQNGEAGTELVEWLNGLAAAEKVLKARFEGRPISEQNLSEWKQGGYEDWGRHQENCAYAAMLMEMSSDLEVEAGKKRLEERLVAPLAMGLARLLREAEEMPAGPDRHRMILDVARQLSQLRRIACWRNGSRWSGNGGKRRSPKYARARPGRPRWRTPSFDLRGKRTGIRRKRPLCAANARRGAGGLLRRGHTRWVRQKGKARGSRPIKPNQAQSNQIKPNQTCQREKWTCRRRKWTCRRGMRGAE